VPIAAQVVSQPDIVGVIGPSLSGETGAALPTFEQAGLAIITPSATNAELGGDGPRTFHRMVTTDATQGPAMARYLASELGLRRVAVLDDGTLYGTGIADLVASALPALGGQVVVRQAIDPASRDYTTALAEAEASGAEAVFFGGTDEPAARLVRQLRELGSDALFTAPDAVLTSSFITAAGPAAAGAVISCPCAPAAAGERAELRLFASRYLDAFGAAVGPFAPEAYDAATLLLGAIDEAGDDREGVRRAVDAAEIEGVTRTIRFDERGEVAEGPVYLYTVDGATFRPIAEVVGDEVLPGG
jgi:branched-chain amino acid transport system substrate-binding protein